MEKVKLCLRYIKSRFNKWQWGILIFILIFAFLLSKNNIFDRMSYGYQISSLNSEIEYYQKMKTNDSLKIEQLKVDKNEIEKFGREKYLMKNDDEDLFIIED